MRDVLHQNALAAAERRARQLEVTGSIWRLLFKKEGEKTYAWRGEAFEERRESEIDAQNSDQSPFGRGCVVPDYFWDQGIADREDGNDKATDTGRNGNECTGEGRRLGAGAFSRWLSFGRARCDGFDRTWRAC